jgi:hypothetical protein
MDGSNAAALRSGTLSENAATDRRNPWPTKVPTLLSRVTSTTSSKPSHHCQQSNARARLELDDENEAAVREVLNRFGTPASIASAATGEGSAAWERTEHRLENVTIGWLLFGGLLFGVGWLVGVNRLWRSPTWSRSEKLLGTMVLPGGLLWVFFLAPRQVATASGGVALTGWSWWGVLAFLLPLASAAVLVARRRQFHKLSHAV